jgi:hypothetical protein
LNRKIQTEFPIRSGLNVILCPLLWRNQSTESFVAIFEGQSRQAKKEERIESDREEHEEVRGTFPRIEWKKVSQTNKRQREANTKSEEPQKMM